MQKYNTWETPKGCRNTEMLKKKFFLKNIHFSFPKNVWNQALHIMRTQYILLNKHQYFKFLPRLMAPHGHWFCQL